MNTRDFIAKLLQSDLSGASPQDALRAVQVHTLNGNMKRAYDLLDDDRMTGKEVAVRLRLSDQYAGNILLALVQAGVVRRERNADEVFVYERIPIGEHPDALG